MDSPPPPLTTLLARLAASGVDFVLVGGLAAVAQGAPITTHDVDIVHSREPRNVDSLLAFLSAVEARYRGRPGPPLSPPRAALLGPGHNLLMTDLGPLDVLGAIEGGRGFQELVPHSIDIEVAGCQVKVLGLAMIVTLKQASTAPKDKLMLAVLRATLARSRRNDT